MRCRAAAACRGVRPHHRSGVEPIRPILSLALLPTAVASFATAAEGPSFDCARAESSAERLVCEDPTLAALDRRLAGRYAAAVEMAKGPDMGGEDALAELKASQRGWIKGRDDCWKAGDLRACVESAYLRREGELVARYGLDPPASFATWACGGNPADELVTIFHATEQPSVRLEQGDRVAVGVLVPAASGARYEASFGVSFWTKGDEALLEWPEGETQRCTLR